MPRFLLGIDLGTTATKAILLDPDRGVVAEASAPTRLDSPRPGWAEADPEEWWRNAGTLVPRLLTEAGALPAAVAGVGVGGAVPALLCLDASGRPLRPSIQQSDARADAEIVELRTRLAAADVLERTGSPITQQSIGPTVLWLRRHEPEALARTTAICGSYDFVTRRLVGGSDSTEANWALESGLYDFRAGCWAEDIVRACALDPGWLGRVRRPSEIVGAVAPGPAAEVGLRAGTPVVAGSADHVASAFAAGLVEDGDLLLKLGGSADVLFTASRPVADARLYLDFHLVPGKFVPNGCMAAGGSLVRWFQRELAGGAPLEELDREAELAGVGAGGLVALPYVLGEKTPLNDPLARGAFVGLHLGHTRGHLFRAVLEAIAFGLAHHVEVLRELGLEPRRARITNGGSRSRLWRQIVADVLGMPLESIVRHPGSSLGAAFAAGMGVGLFGDWSEIEHFVAVAERITPDPVAHERYVELYGLYRTLYPLLAGSMHHLARLGADLVS